MNNHPYLKIIAKNTFTLFNLVNLILAVMVTLVGSYKNTLFLGVAIINTLISTINGIRAQKTIDQLKLISEKLPVIERQGIPTEIKPEEVKTGDLCILSLGDQIQFDSTLEEGQLEINESFITGEQDNILKKKGDHLTSGSFVVAGSGKARVEQPAADSSIAKLEQEAHVIKQADSQLFRTLNNIVKYISYALIPIGALLLWARFRVAGTTTETAVTSTVAALVSMIPEGLILLTSSVLALATVRLSRQKVLVENLYSIETMARVDTICLDKTGTLTTGQLKVVKAIPARGISEKRLERALAALMSHLPADNATSTALKAKYARNAEFEPTAQNHQKTYAKNASKAASTDDFSTNLDAYEIIPFSSDRKYSGITNDKETLLLGAPEILLDDLSQVPDTDKRVLVVVRLTGNLVCLEPTRAKSEEATETSTGQSRAQSRLADEDSARRAAKPANQIPVSRDHILGFVLLEDETRTSATKIIKYFYDNEVTPIIISGDRTDTVVSVANQVGFKSPTPVDLSRLHDSSTTEATASTHEPTTDATSKPLPRTKSPNYEQLVQKYNIFTRVTPVQKQRLVEALKKQGRTVAMTGDGVNDILAMKQADCSIAIGHGADAARRAANLVLLNSDFATVPEIIKEGRRSINNLERSGTLFLTKTIYASILAILFCIIPLEYPYSPIEMTLLNFVCIGFPGVVLALEPNFSRIKNQFTKNIKKYSLPTGLAVAIAALTLAIVAHFLALERHQTLTLSALITFIINFALLIRISRPFTKLRAGLLITIVVIMATAFLWPFAAQFFDFIPLF